MAPSRPCPRIARNRLRRERDAVRCGFTLTELLISIGIAILLIGALLPAVMVVYGRAERAQVRSTLAALENGLSMYEADHGRWPRFNTAPPGTPPTHLRDPLNIAPDRGARLLARALFGIAPANMHPDATPGDAATNPDSLWLFQDGHDGFGFHPVRQDVRYNNANANDAAPYYDDVFPGPHSPPYLEPDQFRFRRSLLEMIDPTTNRPWNEGFGPDTVILDPSNDRPILYYPARPRSPNLYRPDGYVAITAHDTPEVGLYNAFDNRPNGEVPPLPTRDELLLLLGGDPATGAARADRDPITRPYLLIATGVQDNYTESPTANFDPAPPPPQ